MYQQPDVTTYDPTLPWEEGMIATVVSIDPCSDFVQVLTCRGSVGWIFPSVFLPCVNAQDSEEQSNSKNDEDDSSHVNTPQTTNRSTFFSSLLQKIRDLLLVK